MPTRIPRHIAAMVLAAFLLGAPEVSRSAGSGTDLPVPEPVPRADNAAMVPSPRDNAALPAPDAAGDNAVTVSPAPGDVTEAPSPAGGETEMREPSFAAETPPPP